MKAEDFISVEIWGNAQITKTSFPSGLLLSCKFRDQSCKFMLNIDIEKIYRIISNDLARETFLQPPTTIGIFVITPNSYAC